MKTIKQVRNSFWEYHPEFKPFFKVKKRQNDYNADIRMIFIDFVDHLCKDGIISEKLASRVTL